MNRKAADILKEALALPSEARAALAACLLDSLDANIDEDAEPAWATELHRRLAELDCRAVNTVPWAEVVGDSTIPHHLATASERLNNRVVVRVCCI